MGVESYKHQFAKSTLAGWFREIAKDSHDKYVSLDPISWRVNRAADHYGVWMEYPICLNSQNHLQGLFPVWDECLWDYTDEERDALERDQDFLFSDKQSDTRPPTYDECCGMELLPIAIYDVAIQHKGGIVYGFEVVHRNDVSAAKLEYLKRIRKECGPIVFTISADWILSQIRRPEQLVCERIV